MKKSNLVLVFVMVALMITAWGTYLFQAVSASQARSTQLEQAERYAEKSLYQKAAACYEVVLTEKENADVRQLWVEAYESAYNDGAVELGEYAEALEQACSMYPDEEMYWEKLLSLYIENDNMNAAYKSYTKCKRGDASSDLISEYGNIITYANSLKGRAYTDYTCSFEGYYSVFDGEEWGVLDSFGDTVHDSIYKYISPYNNDNVALFASDEDIRIINEDSVVEEKIDKTFSKTGTYEDGVMAVCTKEGSWRYLNCSENKYMLDTYENASNFSEGVAAVCKSGKWTLIDEDGQKVCKTVFSDIKLHQNRDYHYDGVMVAAVDGEYGFYSAKGEPLGEFKAKNMDVYLGEDVAFADTSGKWGFVSKDEEIIIKPRFKKANSFANKLAAVSDGELWGFVNDQGVLVIDREFLEAGYFTSGGTCMVSVQEGFYNLLKLKFVD